MARRLEQAIKDTGTSPITDGGSALSRLGRLSRRNPLMVGGIAVVLFMSLLAISAPILFTGDLDVFDARDRLQTPSSSHWFGTDSFGRDIYTRTIYGSRVSLLVGISVALIAVAAGIVIGILAGYYRRLDAVIVRVLDGVMSIPIVLLAMALVALLGGSVQNVIIALCVSETPRAARVVRASVLGLREQMYIDAARALGFPAYRILVFHVLPNVFVPLIVQATFIGASAVLTEAYLSFLGAGTPPDVPSWGNIMADGGSFITRAVWIIFFPGMFLTLTILGINIAGDGLRDHLDPRLRRQM